MATCYRVLDRLPSHCLGPGWVGVAKMPHVATGAVVKRTPNFHFPLTLRLLPLDSLHIEISSREDLRVTLQKVDRLFSSC